MKIENVLKFIFGMGVIWFPILGTIIAEKLSKIITMDMIMTVIYISIPILFIWILKMEFCEK